MDVITNQHSLTDFWKTPLISVSFDGSRPNLQKNGLVLQMPPADSPDKPSFYTWDTLNLFVSISGLDLHLDDLSKATHVDPAAHRVTIPFNLDQAVWNLLTEQYMLFESNQSFFHTARRYYYKLKPVLPRLLQVWFRQKVVERMSLRKFPAWIVDTTVELLHRNMMSKLLDVSPVRSIPMISFWPQGKEISLVLTHDVETQEGIGNIQKIIDIEQKLGFCSSWNFIPEKYKVDVSLLKELQSAGFEIGVHGLNHDGRLFESYNVFKNRANKINKYLAEWGSSGFRSESNLRNLDWISTYIHAAYDSSCVSTELYGAQPGGCCSVFPFIYNGLVELPITIQQDFTLLDILKLTPNETLKHWITTVNIIKNLNGLVLISVHPDYLTTPSRLDLYQQFLVYLKHEIDFWHALPKDVARWWVDRNTSELTLSDAGWFISGPASSHGVVKWVCNMGNELVIQSE